MKVFSRLLKDALQGKLSPVDIEIHFADQKLSWQEPVQ